MALHSLSFIYSDFSVKFHIVKISFIESFFWQMSLLLEKNGKRRSLVQELKLKLKYFCQGSWYERVMTPDYTYPPTTLTAMCQRVNFIFASISVFNETILWIYRDLFFPRFSLF